MPTINDYLFSTGQRPGVWVGLVNNITSIAYVSSAATDGTGRFGITLPAGIYTFYTSNTGTGTPPGAGWTPTGDTAYTVTDPIAATDVGGSFTSKPNGWGANWRAARAANASRPVNVLLWGDSTHQFYSSNWFTKGWAGKLLTDLQSTYSDGGGGFRSCCENPALVAGTPTGMMSLSGSWSQWAGGINQIANYPTTPATGSLTWNTVRGTTIDIWWLPITGSANDFTYNIDGAGAVTVHTQSAATTLQTTTVTGLSAGNHTVVLTATVGSPFIFGVTGRNATGIIGYNMGRAARSSNVTSAWLWPGASNLASTETIGKTSIQNFAALDLFVHNLGINDCAGLYPWAPEVLSYNAAQACQYAKASNSACDIIFTITHFGKVGADDATYGIGGSDTYATYVRELKAVAATYGAAVIDLWQAGRNSWAYWNGLGYWGDGTADGLAGTDTVHPSDAGHAYIESLVLQLVTS